MVLEAVTMDPVWSAADIARLKAAVVALASGEAVQTVSYAGPPARTVTYQPADLTQMRALLAEMVASVNNATGARSSYRYATTRKGF
jgi:hypothetical protein